jgi:hypothetical protein
MAVRKELFYSEFQRVFSFFSRLAVDIATFYSGLLPLASRKLNTYKITNGLKHDYKEKLPLLTEGKKIVVPK